jgi:hypothetical protein
MTTRNSRNNSRSRRFGPLEVSQVSPLVMARAKTLARQSGRRLVIIDQRTVIVENSR